MSEQAREMRNRATITKQKLNRPKKKKNGGHQQGSVRGTTRAANAKYKPFLFVFIIYVYVKHHHTHLFYSGGNKY